LETARGIDSEHMVGPMGLLSCINIIVEWMKRYNIWDLFQNNLRSGERGWDTDARRLSRIVLDG
jgi:hypothetical protein